MQLGLRYVKATTWVTTATTDNWTLAKEFQLSVLKVTRT